MRNKEILNSIQSALDNNDEFAVIAPPLPAVGKRLTHFFYRQGQDMASRSGSKLIIRPFNNQKITAHSPKNAGQKAHYISIVSKAVSAIRAGELNKVVLARTRTIKSFDRGLLAGWLDRALDNQPESFVFMVATKGDGIWFGASPELLVEKQGTRFKTIALAATSSSSHPLWSAKDYGEHGHVVSYIERALQRPEVHNFVKDGPHDFRYGPITHLKTDVTFSAELSLPDAVAIIHPTPALCGYPKGKALDFIAANEAVPRGYYTGSIIIEEPNGDGVAFAPLRCGNVIGSELVMYSGCGIVAGSEPNKEWEESEAKMSSIINNFPRPV